jgi:Zn-dependent protease
MFNKKEVLTIIVTALIIGFSISLIETWNLFLYSFVAVLGVILINIIAKKISSYYLDSEVEVKFWEIERYGFKPTQALKKPFPLGIFLPLISKIFFFSLGSFVWMASLVFDVKPKIYRAVKRHGLYSFSEMTEIHEAWIAGTGIAANLLFALIGYLVGLDEFARINLYYVFFNMIPISDLDGNKIFFGSFLAWSVLATIILIAIAGLILIH